MNTTVITPIPSPYQVELFDALPAAGVTPRVVYVERTHPDRRWAVPVPAHEHVYLEDGPGAAAAAEAWSDAADLVVVSWYADPRCRGLMRRRAASGRPWAFWGERPGFGRAGLLGRARRRVRLAPLRRGRAPVWGIGSWAVAGWRREFGPQRMYANVPYASDLSRFSPPPDRRRDPATRRLLFSGSLTPRKGVDLLAKAFVRVARSHPNLRLDLVGGGPLETALRRELAAAGGGARLLGFAGWGELPRHYHQADVLVAPSRYDGWGLIVPEGLAAGLPVIGTDQTGAALDLVTPGVNGWRIAAGDRQGLANALAAVATMPAETLNVMSAAARASVAGHQLSDGARRWAAAAVAAAAGHGA